MEEKNKNKKKIVFNEEIDSAISGYALAMTFIGIGIFLLNNMDYFNNKIISYIVLGIVSVIGIIGTTVELDKNKVIKGFGDIGVGIVFLLPWLIVYIFSNSLFFKIITLISLLIGGFAFISGILKIIVSIFIYVPGDDNKIKKITVNFFKALPAIASFVLVIFNIIKIILEIKNI